MPEFVGLVLRLVLSLSASIQRALTVQPIQMLRRTVSSSSSVLVRRRAYFAVQGHAGEPDAILDDASLARRVKQAGYCIWLMGGPSLVRTRMYQDFKGLWEGTSKNAAELMARQNPLWSALSAFGMAVLGVLSVWLPLVLLLALLMVPGWSTGIAAVASWRASSILLAIQIVGEIRVLRLPW